MIIQTKTKMFKKYDIIILELTHEINKFNKQLQEKCKVFEKMSKDYEAIEFNPRYYCIKDTLYKKITTILEEMHNLQLLISNNNSRIEKYHMEKDMMLDVSLINLPLYILT